MRKERFINFVTMFVSIEKKKRKCIFSTEKLRCLIWEQMDGEKYLKKFVIWNVNDTKQNQKQNPRLILDLDFFCSCFIFHN